MARKRVGWPVLRVFGGVCFLLATGLLFELGFGEPTHPPRSDLPYGPGGYLAGRAGRRPGVHGARSGSRRSWSRSSAAPGSWILLVLSAVISFMLATEMAFYPAVVALREWLDG